jgi:hypothetical protein
MKMFQKLVLLLSLAGVMVACATTTQLRKTWSDPSLAKNPVAPFNKVFILVKAKTEENRKVAEDKIVSLLRKGTAIPSYTYVTPADTSQKELVEKLIKDGFDGVITMRVKSVVQTRTKTSSPGTAYAAWYPSGPGYGYSYSYSYTVDPGAKYASSNVDVNSAKDYIIETNIYSLESKKLLWSGVTASLSAKNIDPAMNGIVTSIRKELKKKGFIKKEK